MDEDDAPTLKALPYVVSIGLREPMQLFQMMMVHGITMIPHGIISMQKCYLLSTYLQKRCHCYLLLLSSLSERLPENGKEIIRLCYNVGIVCVCLLLCSIFTGYGLYAIKFAILYLLLQSSSTTSKHF